MPQTTMPQNTIPSRPDHKRPDHKHYDALIAEQQSAPFSTPPGGYPKANPADTRVAPTSRAEAVADRGAARELGAYGDATYSESVLQKRKSADALSDYDPTQ